MLNFKWEKIEQWLCRQSTYAKTPARQVGGSLSRGLNHRQLVVKNSASATLGVVSDVTSETEGLIIFNPENAFPRGIKIEILH